jgi:hypothetical protein
MPITRELDTLRAQAQICAGRKLYPHSSSSLKEPIRKIAVNKLEFEAQIRPFKSDFY